MIFSIQLYVPHYDSNIVTAGCIEIVQDSMETVQRRVGRKSRSYRKH